MTKAVWTKSSANRRELIAGSAPRSSWATIRLPSSAPYPEKHGEIEDLSNRRWYEGNTGAPWLEHRGSLLRDRGGQGSGGSDARVITDQAPFLWIWRERRPDVELEGLSNWRWYAASTSREPLSSNIGVLSYEAVGFLLGRLLRTILILLRFRSRNKYLRLSAFYGVSSNRLVPPKPQGRLR